MQGKRLMRSIRLTNFLSYGPDTKEIELGPLNVLIGPNASGKSNLIEALGLLHAAPVDLLAPIRAGGGVGEWLWKGAGKKQGAEIDVTLYYPDGPQPLRHRIRFNEAGQKFDLEDEVIENEHASNFNDPDPYFYYRYQGGHPAINTRSLVSAEADQAGQAPTNIVREGDEASLPGRYQRSLRRESITPNQSILAQKKDADTYPELTYVGEQYRAMMIFREWGFGRNTAPRRAQQTDLPTDFLLEDASNLALVLNDLEHRPGWSTIMEKLREFYDDIESITTKLQGGTVQVYIHEKGLKKAPVPATRLSDGMLRYLCMLSILCHPEPPPLICIEEPEMCLHPDVIPALGRLMLDAAQRTQLIVTTHSDALVSSLSEEPESIVVCERDAKGSHLRRLQADQLKTWLEKYSLGDLWRMGELGGTRW
jgi:predicted ATPase